MLKRILPIALLLGSGLFFSATNCFEDFSNALDHADTIHHVEINQCVFDPFYDLCIGTANYDRTQRIDAAADEFNCCSGITSC